jgi:hypothetical protein
MEQTTRHTQLISVTPLRWNDEAGMPRATNDAWHAAAAIVLPHVVATATKDQTHVAKVETEFDPDAPMCQDDHEYFTQTGKYAPDTDLPADIDPDEIAAREAWESEQVAPDPLEVAADNFEAIAQRIHEIATATPISAFAAHLDTCDKCRTHARQMCETGWRLMSAADVHMRSFPGETGYDSRAAANRILAREAYDGRFYKRG